MTIRYYKWTYKVFGEIKISNGRSYYRVFINGEPTLLNSRNTDLEVL